MNWRSSSQAKFATDIDTQLALFKSMQEGLAERGARRATRCCCWGPESGAKLCWTKATRPADWTYRPLPARRDTRKPMGRADAHIRRRRSADRPFLSSRVHGEPLTGIVRSQAFTHARAALRSSSPGHNGPPPEKWEHEEHRAAARREDRRGAGRVAAPPRNDTAQKIDVGPQQVCGPAGVLRGDRRTQRERGYAWLAFGRFDPPVIRVPTSGPRLLSAVADRASRCG